MNQWNRGQENNKDLGQDTKSFHIYDNNYTTLLYA